VPYHVEIVLVCLVLLEVARILGLEVAAGMVALDPYEVDPVRVRLVLLEAARLLGLVLAA